MNNFLKSDSINEKKGTKKAAEQSSNYFSSAGKKIRTSTEETLHKILSLARLPIPPYPHATENIIHIIKKIIKMIMSTFLWLIKSVFF